MSYWPEFLVISTIHLLALASPGPDFAMILKTSLSQNRRHALWVAFGISLGIAIHVSYTLLGLGFLILHSTVAFTLFKIIGATYLIYVGVKSLRSQPKADLKDELKQSAVKSSSAFGALRSGFFVNLLNPKASLFCLALFSTIVSKNTPQIVQMGYGIWIIFTTWAWFTALSILLTHERVQQRFAKISHWLERLLGGLLIALGAKIAFLKAL